MSSVDGLYPVNSDCPPVQPRYSPATLLPDENSSTSTSSSSMTIARPILRASMLRPSAFSSQLFSKPPVTEEVEPGAGAAVPVQTDEAKALSQDTESKLQVTEAKENEDTKKVEVKEKPAGDPHPLALMTKSNGLAKSNPFTANQVTALSSSSGFVFGQNVRDRVTGNVEDENANGTGSGGGSGGGGSGESNGDLTFSAATAENDQNMADAASGGGVGAASEEGGSSGKSLSDVAREYEENKNARKRKFEEVETFTGEEDEINVLDVSKQYLAAAIDWLNLSISFVSPKGHL